MKTKLQNFPKNRNNVLIYLFIYFISGYCRQNFLPLCKEDNRSPWPTSIQIPWTTYVIVLLRKEAIAPETMTMDFWMLTVKVRRTCVPFSLTSPSLPLLVVAPMPAPPNRAPCSLRQRPSRLQYANIVDFLARSQYLQKTNVEFMQIPGWHRCMFQTL